MTQEAEVEHTPAPLPEGSNDYWLYILMRTDINSMNPGKAVAHGAHAANQFDAVMKTVTDPDILAGYEAWVKSAEFFGTTIALSATAQDIENLVDTVGQMSHSVAGKVFDPTYPVRDGAITHFLPLTTCGFYFGPRYQASLLLAHLELMR